MVRLKYKWTKMVKSWIWYGVHWSRNDFDWKRISGKQRKIYIGAGGVKETVFMTSQTTKRPFLMWSELHQDPFTPDKWSFVPDQTDIWGMHVPPYINCLSTINNIHVLCITFVSHAIFYSKSTGAMKQNI